ncbi:MAG: 1-acyl-sn-glycerol-3-phosphate acyltransferase [Devosia sp.]|nr:1-acyl-sn-glycerol-3-phosphate acyltransferase [Devosia sp.]
MSNIVPAIRSLLFYLVFYLQTAVLAIVIGLIAIVARRRTRLGWALALYWIHSHILALRLIVGIRTDIAGEENIPDGPCIIASKHMSDWDIFALLPGARRPAFVAKKELMDIPFFGQAAMSFDTIRLDRALGSEAIPRMIEEARAASLVAPASSSSPRAPARRRWPTTTIATALSGCTRD